MLTFLVYLHNLKRFFLNNTFLVLKKYTCFLPSDSDLLCRFPIRIRAIGQSEFVCAVFFLFKSGICIGFQIPRILMIEIQIQTTPFQLRRGGGEPRRIASKSSQRVRSRFVSFPHPCGRSTAAALRSGRRGHRFRSR